MNSDNRRLREIQQEKKVWQDQLNKCEASANVSHFRENSTYWKKKKKKS